MWTLTIGNIAGIRHGTAAVQPGINAVEGSNWEGKSSLITAVGTALGVHGRLTEGAERGRVELETPDGVHEIELVREDGTTLRRGEAYLDDERTRTCARLFAVLDGSNPVRRAVEAGEDLKDPLTRPLDLENIDQRISERRAERDRLQRELDEIEQAEHRLASVEETVVTLEAELATLREKREAVGEGGDDIDAVREALSDKRAARDRTRNTVERLRRQIDDLEDRLSDRQEELNDLDGPDADGVEERLDGKRDRLEEVEEKIEFLRTVFNANRRVLEDEDGTLLAEVERSLDGDEIVCWVCGGTVTREAIERRVDELNDRLAEFKALADDIEEEIRSLESQQRAVEKRRQRRRDLEDEIRTLEDRLADRRSDLDAAEDRLAELDEAVADLEERVEDADERFTDIESDIKYKEAELEDAREELDRLEGTAKERPDVEARLDEVTAEVEALRTRRDRVEREVRDAFDRAMRDVVDVFDPGFETARLTSGFELVVARNGREVDVDALSDGEVELLGIVAALAGYETFDVADDVPVILLDRVGDLSGENLRLLVEYLDGRARYVVTTAYPEQTAADWHTLTPDEWRVVSDPEVEPPA